MDDPTREESGETIEEFLEVLRKHREEVSMMTPERRAAYYAEAREFSRSLGGIIIESEDHPMHPRNIHKRRVELGVEWKPPEHVPPPST
jgi:hypothetical protein